MSEVKINQFQMLVDHFKGQENTATALQVKQPSVSGWVNGTKNMSEKVAIRAQKVTEGKFKASDLCPSLRELEEINLSKN